MYFLIEHKFVQIYEIIIDVKLNPKKSSAKFEFRQFWYKITFIEFYFFKFRRFVNFSKKCIFWLNINLCKFMKSLLMQFLQLVSSEFQQMSAFFTFVCFKSYSLYQNFDFVFRYSRNVVIPRLKIGLQDPDPQHLLDLESYFEDISAPFERNLQIEATGKFSHKPNPNYRKWLTKEQVCPRKGY